MPRILTVEELQILNDLVQDGLIEVVSIDAAGEPSYQIASRFRNAAIAGIIEKLSPAAVARVTETRYGVVTEVQNVTGRTYEHDKDRSAEYNP